MRPDTTFRRRVDPRYTKANMRSITLRSTFSLATIATVATVATLALGAGCATTTKITSDPPGATVTLEKDKKEIGKTPLNYESKMWIWESERVIVKAPGRKPKTVEIKRSEFDALPFLGGACVALLTPYCLCLPGGAIIGAGGFKLPAETKVTLEKDAAGGDPMPAPAPVPAAASAEPAAPGDAVAITY
jgi:hypothetical protein